MVLSIATTTTTTPPTHKATTPTTLNVDIVAQWRRRAQLRISLGCAWSWNDHLHVSRSRVARSSTLVQGIECCGAPNPATAFNASIRVSNSSHTFSGVPPTGGPDQRFDQHYLGNLIPCRLVFLLNRFQSVLFFGLVAIPKTCVDVPTVSK